MGIIDICKIVHLGREATIDYTERLQQQRRVVHQIY